jgi:hypothetical protein
MSLTASSRKILFREPMLTRVNMTMAARMVALMTRVNLVRSLSRMTVQCGWLFPLSRRRGIPKRLKKKLVAKNRHLGL